MLDALADTYMAMGDRMAAGRWLLTYIDQPDDSQRASINLFVDRYRSGGYRLLLSQLPASMRPRTLDDSPTYLRFVLRELGRRRFYIARPSRIQSLHHPGLLWRDAELHSCQF
ncbi:MAG: hypothetical protein R3C05_02470 [Pirellulaceae bacterium]